MSLAEAYNAVFYPSAIFRQCHPDRIGMIARLHGIPAAAADACRMLEVGGGDGLNAIAVAAAFPGTQCVNFDIAALPVENGRRWSEAAGLPNMSHHVLDILEAADTLEGPFDYIVAHGIYAWVPPLVAEAVLAMIAGLLSPNGVAFISYNAFPGGHSRLAVRDLMYHHAGHLAGATKLAAGRAALRAFLAQPASEEPIVAAMRKEAEAALRKPDGLLFHDELSSEYHPQSLLAVTGAAARHGLAYLGESGRGGLDLGFVDPDRAGMGEEAWLRALQGLDYTRGRYFRSSLFVRREQPISRVIVAEAARDMWASTRATPLGDGRFKLGNQELAIADPRAAATIERLAALKPGRLPVRTLITEDTELLGLCQRALGGFVDLHTSPAPFVAEAGERPVASPLARVQAADGQSRIATLDHRMIEVADPALRRLIPLLDGTKDRASLHADVGISRLADQALLSA